MLKRQAVIKLFFFQLYFKWILTAEFLLMLDASLFNLTFCIPGFSTYPVPADNIKASPLNLFCINDVNRKFSITTETIHTVLKRSCNTAPGPDSI